MSTGPAYDVKEISANAALEMVIKYHYSNTLPRLNKHFVGFYKGGRLVGVVTLGHGTRPRHTIQKLFPGLDTKDYYEIGRMCMTDEMQRNSESQMLSLLSRWIKKNEPQIKVLFTWADGMMGKPGYVYQACSFSYVGFIETDMYVKDGVKIHPRKMKKLIAPNDRRITVRPSLEEMRKYGIEHWRGRQFKYFKILAPRKEKKRLLKTLKEPLQEYPKKESLVWRKQDLVSGKWIESAAPTVGSDDSAEVGGDSRQMSLF